MREITVTNKVEAALCPIRNVIAKVTGKWQILILLSLEDGPQRFNAVKRLIGDITQRVLTENLRKLERDGYITRTVSAGPPLAVTYELTDLGHSLVEQLIPLLDWSCEVFPQVEASRAQSDLGD
ncbi:MAG: helix-turn-helix domain-containing protein [Chloroflexota bacterium]